MTRLTASLSTTGVVTLDRVVNVGTARAGPSAVGYYLSRDRARGGGDVLLGAVRRVRALGPGAASSERLRVRLPARLRPGPYFVLACADARRVVTEAREGNNCRSSARRLGLRRPLGAPLVPQLLARPADPTNVTSARFAFSSPGRNVAYQCRLDRAPYRACRSSVSFSNLTEGRHVFRVRARDRLSRKSPPRLFAWTVDLTPPAAPWFVAAPAADWNSRTAEFVFAAVESAGGFECRLDGFAFIPCASPQRFGGFADGTHTFAVRSIDAAGNAGTPRAHEWTVDTVEPATPTIIAGPDRLTRSTSAAIAFTVADTSAQARCSLNGGSFVACASPQAYAVAEGQHTFAVQAVDRAGNVSGITSVTWTVDTTPPAPPTLSSKPDPETNAIAAEFSFLSEPGATLSCRLDASPFAPCHSPVRIPGPLAEARHLFEVKATDAAGNEGPVASFAWTVDTTPPSAPTIAAHPRTLTNATDATFRFEAAGESRPRFLCAVDLAAASPCTSPHYHAGPLREGTHVFAVKVQDPAGNVGPPASFTWTVDTTPPPAPIVDTGPESPTENTTAVFTFRRQGADATLSCRLDGAAAESCASPRSYGPLADGPHRFAVIASDEAGNSRETVKRWVIDTTAPPAPGLDLGVFPGPVNVAGVATFSSWLRRPIGRVLDYFEWGTWAKIESPHAVDVWKNTSYELVYSVPLIPETGGTIQDGARGVYNGHFVKLAQRLVAAGQGDVVLRLGWEFNGAWYPWTAKDDPAAFIGYWRQIVNAMRGVPGAAFRFDWSVNFGPSAMNPELAYPGDAYVDYIGINLFDQDWYPGWEDPVLRWRNFVNLPFGLQWHQDFAAAHGKPAVLDEWGLTARDDGHGGGDDPYYIEKVYHWLNGYDLRWAIYFEFDKEDGRHTLMTGQFPTATQRFKALFGS